MNKSWRNLAATAAIVLLGASVMLTGCSRDGNEWQRMVVEVAALNGGAPLLSGYWDAGSDKRFPSDDDFLPIDYVTVQFHARPYDQLVVLPEDAPFSYFHVTEYDLIWTPLTEGSEELVNYNLTNAPTDVLVPVGSEAEVSILVADRYMKEQQWYRDLAPPPDGVSKLPFQASCRLIFRGHETGNEEVVEIEGAFMASFVGVAVRE